ncbi:UNKNOWN [Stylonychia lemnae]|uniref:Uncharacterized protein n=1 Tax=Stylonychia lemnae TaxID=5949 RepID=A0A078AT39_STYLE|nr:UNKNOWN [Stylonychia lemnae]|eukprot:CDW85620.1 UNKNOWN [Stylonychia lemnae]
MMDKYGQIVGADFTKGSNIFDVIGGIAVISEINVVGTPGSSYQLIFSSDGIDLSKKSNKDIMNHEGNQNLDFNLDFKLRECEVGEKSQMYWRISDWATSWLLEKKQ